MMVYLNVYTSIRAKLGHNGGDPRAIKYDRVEYWIMELIGRVN